VQLLAAVVDEYRPTAQSVHDPAGHVVTWSSRRIMDTERYKPYKHAYPVFPAAAGSTRALSQPIPAGATEN
jgi:hypothetical protein